MLIRHTLLYLPAQFIGPAIQFISIIIWAYVLTPADVGIVTLIIAMQEMSFAVFFMWWSHYALRFISGFKGSERRKRFLSSELTALFICGALQSAVVIPALMLYFPKDMPPVALATTALFMLTRSVNNYMSERARSEAYIGLYTFIQTAGPLFGLVFGLALLFEVSRSPASILGGFAIMQTLSLLIAFRLSDLGRVRPRFDRELLFDAAHFGIPVMMASMLALVAINAPRFVVEHYMGLAAVGAFSVGYGLGLRASSVAVMLVTVGAYPLVVRKMEQEGVEAAYEQMAKNITLVGLVVIPVAFGLLAVNTSVVDLVIPPDYREATYLILPLATIGGLMRYLRAHTTDQVFLVRSRPGFITMISVVDLIFGVLSSYFGLRLGGIAGAALGPVISGAMTFAASLLLSRLILGFRFPVFPLLAITASAALMGAIVYNTPPGPGFLGLGLRVALGAVIYAGAIIALFPPARHRAFIAARKLSTRAS